MCMFMLYQQAAVARVGCCAKEGACVLQCDLIFLGEWCVWWWWGWVVLCGTQGCQGGWYWMQTYCL